MERCILCGGKLADGKCTECGLDNTKNDKKYHLNIHNEKGTLLHRGDCEDHLNRDSDWRERLREGRMRAAETAAGNRQNGGASSKTADAQTVQQLRRKRKKELEKRRETGTVKKKRPLVVLLVWFFVLFCIVSVLIGVVRSLIWDAVENLSGSVRSGLSVEEQEIPDSLAPAVWEKDAEEYFELALAPGFYTVGYEIPAGRYQITCEEGTADIHWDDPEEGYIDYVFLYSEKEREEYQENQKEECPFFLRSEVIELKEGAVVQMDGDSSKTMLAGMADESVALRPHKAQEDAETVLLEDDMVVGEDFAEGVYDLVLDEPEDANEYRSAYVEVDNEDSGDSLFLNVSVDCPRYLRVPFQEGDMISVDRYGGTEEDCIVRLVPSY